MVEHFDVTETLGDVADEREGVRENVPCRRRHRRLLLSLRLVAAIETLKSRRITTQLSWNVSMGASILVVRSFVKRHQRKCGKTQGPHQSHESSGLAADQFGAEHHLLMLVRAVRRNLVQEQVRGGIPQVVFGLSYCGERR